MDEVFKAFYLVCDREHAECSDRCPVFKKHGGTPNFRKTRMGCDCFKDGRKMYEYVSGMEA